MPALRLKLAGSLLAGGLAGVAALATLTSASSPQLAPAGDSTDTTTQQAVTSPSPCPAGTVEKADSCDRVVTIETPAEQEDAVQPAAPAQPVTVPVRTQTKATSQEPSDDAQESADADSQESEEADEHDGDDQQVEQEDQHDDDDSSESAEQETDD